MSNFFTSEFNLDGYSDDEERENRFLLHMDVDYFYAQVEILKDPSLKGKPIIVGNPNARKSGRGVVLTCSYETRVFGVKSGMSMAEALRKCPSAIIVQSQYGVYGEKSKNIMEILQSYGLPMRKAGSDEAYMDITSVIDPNKDGYTQAKEFGLALKQKIFDKETLTVSIGIGPTLKIAKIGSDYKKPDGITVVMKNVLQDLFIGLSLIKIPGIGPKTAERLKQKGLENCEDLLYKTETELIKLLGSWGEYLFRVFKGETTNRILPRGDRKSISNERTFIGKPKDIETYNEIIDKLFTKTYDGLVNSGFFTKTVDLKIRFNGFDTITRSKSLLAVTQSKDKLFNIVREIVEPYFNDERGLRLIGVGFSNLEKVDESQLKLEEWFTDEPLLLNLSKINPKPTPQKKTTETLDDWF